jgi:hypothetical protein
MAYLISQSISEYFSNARKSQINKNDFYVPSDEEQTSIFIKKNYPELNLSLLHSVENKTCNIYHCGQLVGQIIKSDKLLAIEIKKYIPALKLTGSIEIDNCLIRNQGTLIIAGSIKAKKSLDIVSNQLTINKDLSARNIKLNVQMEKFILMVN